MDVTLQPADQAIVAGFFAVMLGIGIFFSNRMRTLRDYFSGSRRIPWQLSGTSFYMSSFSAFTFVAYSELAYKYGFVAVFIWQMVAVCAIASAVFFASRWRRAVATSPLEYIEVRYGPRLREGLAWMGIPLVVIDNGLKLYAIGNLVSLYLGYDLHQAILYSGTIMLAYTFLGGLWAVLITDFVQFAVMFAAVTVLVPLSLQRVGGFGEFWRGLPDGFLTPIGGDYSPWYLFSFMVIMFLSYSTRWSLVQRYYSVRTDRDARKVGYWVAFLTFIASPILFFPALAAAVYGLPVEDTRNVYGEICRTLLPVGMLGMMIAGMFSATMSMLSSDYNAVAAVITNDIYRRRWGRNASERGLVWVGRLATLAVGALSLSIGLIVERHAGEKDLFQIMADLASVLLPPVGIPMLVGLVSRRVSYRAGLYGFLVGVSAGLGGFFASGLEGSFTLPLLGEVPFRSLQSVPYMTWITTLPTLIGVFGFSYFLPADASELERIGRFIDHVEAHGKPEKGEQEAESGVDFSPLTLVGYPIGILGAIAVCAVWITTGWGKGWVTMVVGGVLVSLGIGAVVAEKWNSELEEL